LVVRIFCTHAHTFSAKTFRYHTPPLKASPTDLAETGFLGAAAVHILATPGEVAAQVAQLRALRVQRGITESPFIVWEPFPAACSIANRQAFLESCKLVDVFSPNHLEMEALFETAATTAPYHKGKLEEYAQEFAKATGPCGSGAVIVRCGEHGSLTVQDGPVKLWLPPYYEMGSSGVVDPTGAGNAFLGGFMAGWKATGDLQEASCCGTVSASFAIEQIGLPSLDFDGDDGLCNGVRVLDRLAQYKVRINQI
jgi:sugar/nucleoside kinase (ribokinase family)